MRHSFSVPERSIIDPTIELQFQLLPAQLLRDSHHYHNTNVKCTIPRSLAVVCPCEKSCVTGNCALKPIDILLKPISNPAAANNAFPPEAGTFVPSSLLACKFSYIRPTFGLKTVFLLVSERNTNVLLPNRFPNW